MKKLKELKFCDVPVGERFIFIGEHNQQKGWLVKAGDNFYLSYLPPATDTLGVDVYLVKIVNDDIFLMCNIKEK